jgi:hypothetical protein
MVSVSEYQQHDQDSSHFASYADFKIHCSGANELVCGNYEPHRRYSHQEPEADYANGNDLKRAGVPVEA